jgi:hypothetical protein
MYMGKYWRESRITFAIAVLVLAAGFVAILRIPQAPPGLRMAGNADAVVIGLLAFPLAFLAWRFGSFGVGHDLGDRTGAFLFTRPRSRAFFVWSDWSYGMAQMLAVVIAVVLEVEYAFARVAPGQRVQSFHGEQVAPFGMVWMHCTMVLLFIGLVFGLTYFCSIVVRNKGMMMAAGLLLAYVVLTVVVQHYWPDVVMPQFMMSEFNVANGMVTGYADNMALSIVARAALALAFPLAAQMLLQRRDID